MPIPRGSVSGFGFVAFVTFIASIMALNGLSIDSMLPALPSIGDTLGVAHVNERQWIIAVFMLGFGAAQLIWGPLADYYGRKPILVFGLSCFAASSILAALAVNFPMLLVARLLQGVAASAARIILVAIVRDCYSGRTMARVMSLALMMFLIVPILAPSVGQLIERALGSWRAIFFTLAAYGAITSAVGVFRLNETLHPEYRRPLSFSAAADAATRVIRDHTAIGYTLASAFVYGSINGFIMSAQQIFADIFKLRELFPVIFAGIAGSMGLAALFNARFVERLGTRRISHSALFCFIAVSIFHVGLALLGFETVYSFFALQAVQMVFFGLLGWNFNSMAMESVGDIAGSASSVQGFVSTCLGAGIGALIGQLFDGTTIPLAIGFLGCGLLALGAVLYAERGRLFRPHYSDPLSADFH